jgi:hypothetical protein
LQDEDVAQAGCGCCGYGGPHPPSIERDKHQDSALTTFGTIKRWLVTVGVVLLGAVVLALVLVSSGSSPFPSSAGTATIRILVPSTGQPTFSGSLGDEPLTGRVLAAPQSQMFATYSGHLGSVPYHLRISGDLVRFQQGQLSFNVSGSYGTKPVTGTARFDLSNGRTLHVPVNVHIGTATLMGEATVTRSTAGLVEVTATYRSN